MDARWIAGLLAQAALLGAAPARAADPPSPAQGQGPPPRPVRLDYQRGPGAQRCPEEQAFRDASGAHAITSAPLFAPDVAARLAVTLRRRGYGYEGTLDLYDATGALLWTNTLPPPSYPPSASCPSLVETLALSATFHIDPVVLLPRPLPLPPPSVATPSPCSVAVVPAVEACQQGTSPPEPPEPSPSPPAPLAPPLSSLSPPKRSLQLVVGVDGIFTPFLAPSASAGFALWAGIDLLNAPLSFELDLRSTWSLVPAHIPLAYQPLFAVRTSYVGGALAGCWRGPISLCPVLEVGSMSFSRADTIGEVIEPSIVVATGGRVVYTRPIANRFVVRGLFEFEVVAKPFLISDVEIKQTVSAPTPVSFTWGVGFGGPL